MCEYDPECSKTDDPRAMVLWKSERPVRLRVVCDTSSWCTLAKVYDLGKENGGLHLCQKFLPETLTTTGWSASMHGHWALDAVDALLHEIETDGVENTSDSACHHGTFNFDLGGLYNALHWGRRRGLRDRRGVAILIADKATRPLWKPVAERRGNE